MSSFIYKNVYIKDYETIAGPKEKESLINFPNTINDYYYNEKNIEDAEMKMQNFCLTNILERNNIFDKTDLIIGGDLLNQIVITSYNLSNRNIPFLGIYNGCSTFNEGLIIMSHFIDQKQIKNGIVITSAHNLNAERQYRYPVEYGCPKKKYTTFTTTGAIATYITNKKTNIKIESATIGKVTDYGIKDVSHMGAVMAPSACQTLHDHLTDLKRTPDYYDIIITGDLGKVGSKIFEKIVKEEYNYDLKSYMDASSTIYEGVQGTFQGGSGPTVLPLVFFNKVLAEKKYKKILLLATGSLHNPTMVSLKKSIPSITHAISIEVIE